jgi:hypothetical protein
MRYILDHFQNATEIHSQYLWFNKHITVIRNIGGKHIASNQLLIYKTIDFIHITVNGEPLFMKT